MKPTLLIFGFGYVAAAVAQHMARKGFEIHITTRRKEMMDEIAALGFLPILFGDTLPAAHAALNTVPPENGADPVLATYRPIDFGDELEWYGYLSATSVYGNTHGQLVDETHPLDPITKKARARVIAEITTLKSSLPAHVFRISGIYGPQRNPLERIKNRTIREVPSGSLPVNRIHVEDIARVIAASIATPKPGRIYNVSDDTPTPSKEVVLHAAKMLNCLEEIEMLPAAEEFLMGAMSSGVRVVDNTRIKKELGVELAYPSYEEGLEQCLTTL